MRTKEEVRNAILLALGVMGVSLAVAKAWMKLPLLDYGMTPEEMVDAGRGEEVYSRLVNLASGSIGS